MMCAKLLKRHKLSEIGSTDSESNWTSMRDVQQTDEEFNAQAFLASIGEGRTITKGCAGTSIFSQGDPADALFYIHRGKVPLLRTAMHAKGV
jgi:CRP-like cAMP-binding protein